MTKVSSDQLGATGKFPGGKLNENDEGELQLGVRARDGVIEVAFGKEVAFLGFDLPALDNFVSVLRKAGIEAAKQLEAKKSE